MKVGVRVLAFLFLNFISINLVSAQVDDDERFKRIKRDEMFKRTPDQIGNRLSVNHPGMRLMQPHLQGNGCADGEADFVLTDDKRTLSVLFNSYVVQAGQSAGKPRDLKNCVILLPVAIPPGHRVAVIGLDYRGFAAVPAGGVAALRTNYQFFNANKEPISRRVIRNDDFTGPYDEDYILTTSLKGRMNWSECGRNIVLRIQTDLSAQTNAASEDTMATLDSIDGTASEDLTYHLMWEKCELPGPGNGPGHGPGPGPGHGPGKIVGPGFGGLGGPGKFLVNH